MELLMDERDQSLEGLAVAPPPLEQQPGDFRRLLCNPAILCLYLDRPDVFRNIIDIRGVGWWSVIADGPGVPTKRGSDASH
jgi:hypothetical protein